MAKRGQVVEEQAVEKTARSIDLAQAAYEKLMNEIREHCQQARELREQAAELRRSGRTDFQVGVEVKQLLAQAELSNAGRSKGRNSTHGSHSSP